MAFAARLGPLSQDLLQSLAPSDTEIDTQLSCSWHPDAVLRKLKTHPYLRTNPFEIEQRLEGLDEKFRVNNREALANALRLRLNSLSRQPSQWHPDVLHLLLELSDQPTFKTRLDSLHTLQQSREPPPPESPLNWQQIAREDGWGRDEDLWKSTSYSSDGSVDDDTGLVSAAGSSEATSLAGDDETPARTAQDYIVHPVDSDALQLVLEAQSWRTNPSEPCVVSELQVVRDVLFMLHGLECSLFDRTAEPISGFRMAGTAPETHSALMSSLADKGRRMRTIRQFVAQPQTVPHVQALQDCLSRRLAHVDGRLSAMESRFALPGGEVVVSLLAVMSELALCLEPALALSRVVSQLRDATTSDTFHCLELLFEEIGVAQLAGKSDTFEVLVRVFVECLNIYLRPVQLWMREGKLLPGDESFFVIESSTHVSLGDTWQSRFQFRKTADRRPQAPSFIRPAVGDIYNAGRNMVVLRLLGKATAPLSSGAEPPLDYDALCPAGFELAPFADMFSAAFGRWVQSRCCETWAILKPTLVGDWGLFESLDALQALYLMADGRAAATLCSALFAVKDAGWRDGYAVTMTGREAYASLQDSSRLVISFDGDLVAGNDSVRAVLPVIKISYRLPWPVQMIVTTESIANYQSIFTLLLQLKKAMHVLHEARLPDEYREDRAQSCLFYATRHKLLWFCATMHTYLAMQVLEPTAVQMKRDLKSADSIETMIATHCGGMKLMTEQACLSHELTSVREKMLDILDLAVRLDDSQTNDCPEDLVEMAANLDQHARFICRQLRSVASASSSQSSAKWHVLADMLQTGVRDDDLGVK
ncbi:gamma-tubulin complex component GCP5 [Ophiocordyceps camponoti-floridani]|uniref:Spindle pole body component n=1 Tax=Ophiocordyceps camponoti-floridani TaxID=2030778 RepID=A0A8H4Q4J1_9HYPO|nr:gamma-tubulin complex component GCP5 [Ophiocordyceps camponoti-floridani]